MTMSRRALSISTVAHGAFSHFITCAHLWQPVCAKLLDVKMFSNNSCIYTEQWRNQRYSFYTEGVSFTDAWEIVLMCDQDFQFLQHISVLCYQWDTNEISMLMKYITYSMVFELLNTVGVIYFGGVERFSENAELQEYIYICPREGRIGN